MTEILPVRYSGHRAGPKLQETRLKGHWLQDDTDSQEIDKLLLLAELHSSPEDHSVKGFYQDGCSFACADCTNGDQKCEDGTEVGKYSYAHTEMGINVKMLNDSHVGRKQLESKVKNMPVAENMDTNKNVQLSRMLYNSQKPKQSMLSVNKIENQIVDRKHSSSSVQESKLQAYIANSAKSKPQAPGLSSSLVNDAHSGKHAVVSGSAAPAATLSLAELAKQHRSQRSKVASVREAIPASKTSTEGLARVSFTTSHHRDHPAGCVVGSFSNCSDSFVGSFESPNERLGKENAKSTPVVLGCSSSTGSLKELPASSSQRAGPSTAGMSLSQLALQHRQSKSPVSMATLRNGYMNGCKPSLLQMMKNVAIDDARTSTAAEAPASNVPSKEPVASLSLTLCLKLNKASDSFTKLPCQQKPETEDMDVSNTLTLMESRLDQPGAESQEQDIPTDLIPQVSSIGLVLCCLKRKRKLDDSSSNMGKTLKYPKFECGIQIGNRTVYPEIVYRKIKPFDFSTPSPDDIVKHKQKQAFTRPQKEFEF